MAADYRSSHVKLTVEADVVVEAHARARDKDRTEIIRDVMHRWALLEIEVARLTAQRLKAEGVSGTAEGESGSEREGRR